MPEPTLAAIMAEVQTQTRTMLMFSAILGQHTDALARIEALLNGAAEPKDGEALHDTLREILASLKRIEAAQAPSAPPKPPPRGGPPNNPVSPGFIEKC